MGLPAHFEIGGTHLQPDRLGIWAVEGGGFGLDVTYTGPAGHTRADEVARALMHAGVRCSLRQELDDRWTVRLGPVERDAMLVVLGAVVL